MADSQNYVGFEILMFIVGMGIITLIITLVFKGIAIFISKLCGNKDVQE